VCGKVRLDLVDELCACSGGRVSPCFVVFTETWGCSGTNPK